MNPEQVKNFLQESYSYFGLEYSESPLQEIEYNHKKLYLKRDDLLPLGCSKQRSIVPMIYHYLKLGNKKFVVSSSGNAGLVAAFCALKSNEIEEMIVYFDKNISDKKLDNFANKLNKYNSSITRENLRKGIRIEDRLQISSAQDPRQEAFNLAKEGFVNLRGSTDDIALIGFETISYEINRYFVIPSSTGNPELRDTDSQSTLDSRLRGNDINIFVPASSGTTAQGIYEGFKKLNLNPKINVVQTAKVHTLVKNLAAEEKVEETSFAESIVDIIGHRRSKIEELVKSTGGKGFIISNKELEEAMQILSELQIETSYDSALTFAAWLKDQEEGAVLVFTG